MYVEKKEAKKFVTKNLILCSHFTSENNKKKYNFEILFFRRLVKMAKLSEICT